MVALERRTVRLHPAKYWAATRSMSKEENETFLQALTRMAEHGDLNALSHFGFIKTEEDSKPSNVILQMPADDEWEPDLKGEHIAS